MGCGRRSCLGPNHSFLTFPLGGLHHVPCPHLENVTREALSTISQGRSNEEMCVQRAPHSGGARFVCLHEGVN